MTLSRQKAPTPKPEVRLTKPTCPAWQHERANRLHRKFLRVEEGKRKGKSIRKQLRFFSWYWRDARYRSNPKVKVQFGRATLYRWYRQWQAGGRVPEALFLNYTPSVSRRLTLGWLQGFVKFCAKPRGTLALLRAFNQFNKIRPCPAGYSAVLRYFTAPQFRAIQKAFRQATCANEKAAHIAACARASIRERFGKEASA